VFDAIVRICKDEGVLTLWRGSTPTIVRGMAINAGMLTTYDEIKERVADYTKQENSKSTRAM